MTSQTYIPNSTAGFPGAATAVAQARGVVAEMDLAALKATRMSLAERLKR